MLYINSINFINCKIPNFVPAGNYTKLECEGIDINPQKSLYLYLKEDFNKNTSSYNYNYNNENTMKEMDGIDNDEKKSSILNKY